MTCFDVQEKMIDLVLGELTLDQEAEIRDHAKQCPVCREELQLLSVCMQTCTLECRFPFRIVIPVAASAFLVATLGYFIFFRSSPEQTVQEETPSYYEYDPYEEMNDLSPEEAEEFIKIINQKYGQ